MPVVRDDMSNLLRGDINPLFMKHFNDAFKNETTYSLVSTLVKSTKDIERYAWLGKPAYPTEWIDEREITALNQEQSYTLTNSKWQTAIEVTQDAIDDEQYGQVMMQVKQAGAQFANWLDEYIWALQAQGESTAGYDGQYFFSSAHYDAGSRYSTTQTNLGSSSFSVSALEDTLIAMRKFKDDNGKVAGYRGTDIGVPPDLEWDVRKTLNSTTYPAGMATGSATTSYVSGGANPHRGNLGVIVTNKITDADAWLVFDNSKPTKAFLLQERKPLTYKKWLNEMRDSQLHGWHWRGVRGFGDWRCAYSHTP